MEFALGEKGNKKGEWAKPAGLFQALCNFMAFNFYKNICSLVLINVAKCTLNQFTAALQAVSQGEVWFEACMVSLARTCALSQ